MKSDKLIYFASPYSSKNPASDVKLFEENYRYERVMSIAAYHMRLGVHVFSPIVHCHPMACKFGLPKDWEYWQTYLKLMLARCDELWVVMLDGWKESVGVQAEIDLAVELGIGIKYVVVDSFQDYMKNTLDIS